MTETLDVFLADLQGLGISLWAEDGSLRYRAPRGAMTEDVRARIGRRKDELLGFLSPVQTAPIPKVQPQEDYALSHAQRRVWILCQDDAGTAAYNIPLAVTLEGPLRTDLFEEALNTVVNRHESLRTVFVVRDGEPRQKVLDSLKIPVRKIDLTRTPDTGNTVEALTRDHALRTFDLAAGPLLRATVVQLGQERHLLLLTVHHIVCDGWSLSILVRECSIIYDALRSGQQHGQPEIRLQYRDYSQWHNSLFESATGAEHRRYWLEKLAKPLPVIDLPADAARAPMQTFNGGAVECSFSPDITEKLHAFCRRNNASLFMALVAAVKVLLHRYTSQDDIIIGSPVAGRINPDLADQIGLYLNTIALRDEVRSDVSFEQLLQQVRRTATEAYEHEVYPFDLLVSELDPPRDLSRSPLFDVAVILQNNDASVTAIGDIKMVHVGSKVYVSKFDVTFDFVERADRLHLGIEFNTDLFSHDRVVRMATHFQTLLCDALANPSRRIGLLRIMPESEREALLSDGHPVRESEASTLLELFEQQASCCPEALAITHAGVSLTYHELNRRANQLARFLRDEGVRPEIAVGICLERSPYLLIALLGVLKAGGFYVPLDPKYPAHRLEYMASDARIALLITQSSLTSVAPAPEVRRVYIDSDNPAIDRYDSEELGISVDPLHCAYSLYTSGSTGRPKGVQITHGALANLLLSTRREPGIRADDILLAVTTVSFDIAALELFLPLVSGAHVVIAPAAITNDGVLLADLLDASNATLMQATPATWQMLINTGWLGRPGLKILCGGEALTRELAAALTSRGSSLWNLYGPTETTIWSGIDEVTTASLHDAPEVRIGRAIRNTKFYVLDPWLQLVPTGVPGELYIGGDGLARGYLGQPAMTAEKFVPNPFGEGDRLYRTGDIVARCSDGRLRFFGRTDSQIKIRGFRIELDEIDSALAKHGSVRQSVTVVRTDAAGDRQLTAYVIPEDVDACTVEHLRRHLRHVLPEYMVPAVFVFLDAFPLTPAGKVDRRSLPAPDSTAAAPSLVPPRNATEARIAEIWQSVLGVGSTGVHDDFFALGGDSLKAAKAVFLISQALGSQLNLPDLFREPTIAGLASVAQKRGAADYIDIPSLEGEVLR